LNCHNSHNGVPSPAFLQAIKPASLGWRRVEGVGNVMVAKQSSKKLKAEMFDDLPVLKR
jgi:hypothetical protein